MSSSHLLFFWFTPWESALDKVKVVLGSPHSYITDKAHITERVAEEIRVVMKTLVYVYYRQVKRGFERTSNVAV